MACRRPPPMEMRSTSGASATAAMAGAGAIEIEGADGTTAIAAGAMLEAAMVGDDSAGEATVGDGRAVEATISVGVEAAWFLASK